ncbi:MAG: formyltetrahydrofolate deformylase [Comamonadaceae bacterium]|nr:MAG: formyltetrahydrofolate deformylase [Comamonadaceae bacterium]
MPITLEAPTPVRSLPGAGAAGRLVMQCSDQPGVVAAVSQFLADWDANITESDQATTDPEGGHFFLRMVFHRDDLRAHLPSMVDDFTTRIAPQFDSMSWAIVDADRPKRVAIMVSKYDHCLLDLLWRARRGELPVDIGLVISNHADLARDVRSFGVPFVHIPVTKDSKNEAEAQQLQLLQENFDLIVMARYMQILSDDFIIEVGCPVINIHHSFLPAFMGANPYARAKERGVKLIGATAHYATADLDEGPIIEQDVARVGHQDAVAALQRRGADVERAVLSRAVLWHCEDRVLRHANSTVVFA